jgi:uncharacterized protein YqeY
MSLKETFEKDLKAAMKSGDKVRVSTIRQIRAAILNKEKEKGEPIDEPGIVSVLQSAVKQRKDSIEQFEKGNRPDLVEQEKSELQILVSYLPVQMSEEEIRAKIEEAVRETGAESQKDMGKLMKVLMAHLKGKADGAEVNRLVRERLS